MEVKILKQEKHDLELVLDNATTAEILRAYLEEQGADFAAWRREHPSKPAVLKVKTSEGSPEKAIKNAVAAIEKDTAKLAATVKK